MTSEQLIVLGVLAAAFVAGWTVRAVIARLDRRSAPAAGAPPEAAVERAVEETRRELDGAIRKYLSTVAFSIGAREAGSRSAPLPEQISTALQDDVANDAMLSAVSRGPGSGPDERELDLVDWGFAYGVAWARARQRDPTAPADLVAGEALRAAEEVFRSYAADAGWAPAAEAADPGDDPAGNGRRSWPAAREPSG